MALRWGSGQIAPVAPPPLPQSVALSASVSPKYQANKLVASEERSYYDNHLDTLSVQCKLKDSVTQGELTNIC